MNRWRSIRLVARREIFERWQALMGPWPPVIEKPRVEILAEHVHANNLIRQQPKWVGAGGVGRVPDPVPVQRVLPARLRTIVQRCAFAIDGAPVRK